MPIEGLAFDELPPRVSGENATMNEREQGKGFGDLSQTGSRRTALGALLAAGGGLAMAATPAGKIVAQETQETEESDAAVAVVEALIDRFNSGDIAGIRELVAGDIETIWPWPTPPGEGADYVERAAGRLKEAFPDAVVTVDETLAEGERVAMRVTTRGTNTDALFTLPPTGREIELSAMFFLRVVGDRIASCVALVDVYALVLQLGLLEGVQLPVGSPVAAPQATPAT